FALWNDAGYFDVSSEFKPLLHLWSLGIEEQFYLLWPVVASLLPPNRRAFQIIGLLAIASFVANLWFVRNYPVATFLFPFPRFWELLAGAGLAAIEVYKLSPGVKRAWTRDAASITGIIAIIASAVMLHGSDPYPGWRAAIPVIGSSLIIAVGPHAWVNRHIL